MPKAEHRNLESFLRNVLQSSEELTKIHNEVRASEELETEMQSYRPNREDSRARQKRRSIAQPEFKLGATHTNGAAKDSHMLRGILDLYLKRAELNHHEKDLNSLTESEQKSGSTRTERGSLGTSSGSRLKHSERLDTKGQLYKHKRPSSARIKIRRRRLKDRTQHPAQKVNKALNNNVNSNMNANLEVNKQVAVIPPYMAEHIIKSAQNQTVASSTQSNIVEKSQAQHTITDDSSFNTRASGSLKADSIKVDAVSPPISSLGFDLDCVNELAPLKDSAKELNSGSVIGKQSRLKEDLYETNHNTDLAQSIHSSVSDDHGSINNAREAKSNDYTDIYSQKQLYEMTNKTKGITAPFPASMGIPLSDSYKTSSGDNMDIVNPIIVDVLEKISKKAEHRMDIHKEFPTTNNTHLSEFAHKNSLDVNKTSANKNNNSSSSIEHKKYTTNGNNTENHNQTLSHVKIDKVSTKNTTGNSSFGISKPKEHRSEIEGSSASDIKNTINVSHASSSAHTIHKLSDKINQKHGSAHLSSQTQSSKTPNKLALHKKLNSDNKPLYNSVMPLANSNRKDERMISEQSLINPGYNDKAAAYAPLSKNKFENEIALKAQMLRNSYNDKSSSTSKQNKANNFVPKLKQNSLNAKHKRERLEKTSEKSAKMTSYKSGAPTTDGESSNQIKENLGLSGNSLLVAKETHQNENLNNKQVLKVKKHTKMSIKTNEVKQQSDKVATDEARENERSHQSDGSVSYIKKTSVRPLRHKRHASRFKKHFRKENWKRREGYFPGRADARDSKLSFGDKYSEKSVHLEENISPIDKNDDNHNTETREGETSQKMLREVEDMIHALKQENHKTFKSVAGKHYNNFGEARNDRRFRQRIGRKLKSVKDEAEEKSGLNVDSYNNDDYYYYDESDVDKHKPEHSKVSQNINSNDKLDKVDPKLKGTQKSPTQLNGIEKLKAATAKNVGFVNKMKTDDKSLSHISSKQGVSQLITRQSNKMSLFNKEMPEDMWEADDGVNSRYISAKERDNVYDGMVSEKISSSRKGEANENSNIYKDISSCKFGERDLAHVSTNENLRTPRLNDGDLEKLNNVLNEIVLNQTASTWVEIGSNEDNYKEHLRFKRAGNVQENNDKVKNRDGDIMLNSEIGNTADKNNTHEKYAKKDSTYVKAEDQHNFNNETTKNKSKIEQNSWNSKVRSAAVKISRNKEGDMNEMVLLDSHTSFANFTNITFPSKEINEIKQRRKGVVLQYLQGTNLHDNKAILNERRSTNKVNETINLQKLNSVGDADETDEGITNNKLLRVVFANGENSSGNSFGAKDLTMELKHTKAAAYGASVKRDESENVSNGLVSSEKQDLSKKLMHNFPEWHKHFYTDYEKGSKILQESIQSPSSLTKDDEVPQDTSGVLVRNKRDDKKYIQEEFGAQPPDIYLDESGTNETNDDDNDTFPTSFTSEESISNTKPPNYLSSELGEPHLPTSAATLETNSQRIHSNRTSGMSDNSGYKTASVKNEGMTSTLEPTESEGLTMQYERITATESNIFKGSITSPNPYQDKLLTTEPPQQSQSFNLPKVQTDDSQLNDTINGALAKQLVALVFETVNGSKILKHHLGNALKKTDYGPPEKQPSYDTGISADMLQEEEEQYHKKTGSLLSKVMELLDVLVEEEVSKRSCITLQPELQKFLLWLLNQSGTGKMLQAQNYVGNFLFLTQNGRRHEETEDIETEYDLYQDVDLNNLNHQIRLLRELLWEFAGLPNNEKVKVEYVYVFLKEQLQGLERIRRSKRTEDLGSRTPAGSSDSLPGAVNKADTTLGSMRNDPSSLENKKTSLASSSASKRKTYSLEEKGKHVLKTSPNYHLANKRPAERRRFLQDLTSASKNVDSFATPTRAHQRRRRYGGHGGTKNKYRKMGQRKHIPTTQYRKLAKRAAEFRLHRRHLMRHLK